MNTWKYKGTNPIISSKEERIILVLSSLPVDVLTAIYRKRSFKQTVLSYHDVDWPPELGGHEGGHEVMRGSG